RLRCEKKPLVANNVIWDAIAPVAEIHRFEIPAVGTQRAEISVEFLFNFSFWGHCLWLSRCSRTYCRRLISPRICSSVKFDISGTVCIRDTGSGLFMSMHSFQKWQCLWLQFKYLT